MSAVDLLLDTRPQDTLLGHAIPDTAHAVSVSLPSWKANVGYEEGEEWVLSKMKNGYPRFFVHLSIEAFADTILSRYGSEDEKALLFPSSRIATRCRDFISRESVKEKVENSTNHRSSGMSRILNLSIHKPAALEPKPAPTTILSVVMMSKQLYPLARKFWQHSGEGISSRRAEFFYKAFIEGHLMVQDLPDQESSRLRNVNKGPKRYQKGDCLKHENDKTTGVDSADLSRTSYENMGYSQFVEERFGRNLDMSLAANAKLAIKRRIAGTLTADIDLEEAVRLSDDSQNVRCVHGFSVNDVYLWPTGMSAIFNTHRMMLKMRGTLKSVMFGFPYIDTLKILEKFGPGALFYGHGSSEDLDDLEIRCKNGEKYLALFCEFPGNPLLKTPDLDRIRDLADRYDFAVVVDETIGNFLNVNVLPLADVVVSSLTKIFSGDSNVMGGSCVLNPGGRYYKQLREFLADDYEDHYWPEDALFMERNSRDFVCRNVRINANADALCGLLASSPYVKKIYYPKLSETRCHFDARKNIDGGYGGLLSLTFYSTEEAVAFFDALETDKGPSLGTNFTLSSPFVILAHYNELEWATQYGAEADLVRISVGLDDTVQLCATFGRALDAIKRLKLSNKR